MTSVYVLSSPQNFYFDFPIYENLIYTVPAFGILNKKPLMNYLNYFNPKSFRK
jgi:hypothetical protein